MLFAYIWPRWANICQNLAVNDHDDYNGVLSLRRLVEQPFYFRDTCTVHMHIHVD